MTDYSNSNDCSCTGAEFGALPLELILMTVSLQVPNLEHYHWSVTLVECVR